MQLTIHKTYKRGENVVQKTGRSTYTHAYLKFIIHTYLYE